MFLTDRAVKRFSRQLAMLLEAGLRIDVALKLIEFQHTSGRWRRSLAIIQQRIRAGETFAQALHSSWPFHRKRGYAETIEWAEETGDPKNLILALRLLSDDPSPQQALPFLPDSTQGETIDLFSRAMRD